MSGSGKEILLRILSDLSTQEVDRNGLDAATQRLRAGLLLHGSTADESYESALQLVWRSDPPEGTVTRQGMATTSGVFLTDILETMLAMPGLEEHLRSTYPQITHQELKASEWALWLVVSSVQMFGNLLPVERQGDLDIDSWVAAMAEKIDHYMRERAPDA